MFFELLIALLDPLLEHDEVSNVESQVEDEDEDDDNGVLIGPEHESQEDLSERAEELEGSHHEDEVSEESVSGLNFVGNH